MLQPLQQIYDQIEPPPKITFKSLNELLIVLSKTSIKQCTTLLSQFTENIDELKNLLSYIKSEI